MIGNYGRAFRVAVGITALVLLLAGGAGAATPISSCTTISSPGEYVLNSDILNSSASSCIGITSSDVVFDGAGYMIDGIHTADPCYYAHSGVYVSNSTTVTNVTVKNLKVTDWCKGIYYYKTQNGSIANNTANSNGFGIYLDSSSNNMLSDNIASNRGTQYGNGITLLASSNNTLSGNNASNSTGSYFLIVYSNKTLNGNTGSTIYHVITVGSGISLTYSSNNNTLSGNNASNNGGGISLEYSSNNTLSGNNANSNDDYGIYLWGSDSNTIYNNIFNNTNNFYFYSTSYTNYWNTTKTPGTNIIGGIYLGGNIWAYPNGTGFSQICTDADSDGICDSSYTLVE